MQQHHGIDYIEFNITDMAAAKSFLSQAFGWTFTDYAPEYAGINVDGKEVAGLRLMDSVTEGGPLVVMYSDDLEASLESVSAAGGRIVQEIFEFPGGRRFEFLDPSGNRLGVWSAAGI